MQSATKKIYNMRQKTTHIGVLILIYPTCKCHKEMQKKKYIAMTMRLFGLPNSQ